MPQRTSRRPRAKRPLQLQRLEKRNLLAARISELLVDAHFGSDDTTQFIELRGEANSTLEQGTYFVVVEESAFDIGVVHGIFDLSGQTFGSNGYLTILQMDSPHVVDPASTLLQSTEVAFGGLPGDIYSDTHPLSERIDFIIGANGYFLIQTDTAPTLGMDIDAENDGVIDPVIENDWQIHDSISLHPFVGRGDYAYGNIVFAEIGSTPPVITAPNGVAVIPTEGFGYAGRVGESEGSNPDDWIASTTDDELNVADGGEARWALVDNLFGEPSQFEFSGRDLDHVGGPNFVGGVKGTILGTDGTSPAAGATVFADANENNIFDRLVFEVDPDDAVDFDNLRDENGFERDFPLLNEYPGVTITKFALDSFPTGPITAEKEEFTADDLSNRVFATGGIDWFTPNGTLRFDFYEPIHAATITAIGGGNSLTEVYGRLDAYNADGDLLDFEISSLLSDGERELLTVSSNDDIAYLMAYADTEFNDGEGDPWGMFDLLVYTQLEPHATTDAGGDFYITNLFPGDYQVRATNETLRGAGPDITVNKYEHFDFRIALQENNAPILTPTTFEIDENHTGATALGVVAASDADGDALTFGFTNDEHLGFEINENTGMISTSADAVFDFESRSAFQLPVFARDTTGAMATTTVTVIVNNINESPNLDDEQFTISESTSVGTVVGELDATDPDLGQVLSHQLIGGNSEGAFSVSNTGTITVSSPLNFEERDQYVLEVQVSDGGSPPLVDIASVTINIGNENESPDVSDFTTSIPENATSDFEVGRVQATDPDQNQTLNYRIDGDNERFSVNFNTGVIIVRPGAVFDHETEPVLTFTVSVADTGTPPLASTALVTVNVADQNETPSVDGFTASISESTNSDLVVGRVEATDPDQGQSIEYQIVDGDSSGRFSIDPVSGIIAILPNTAFDHETEPEITLTVSAADNGTPPLASTAIVTISVSDENEAPTISGFEAPIAENAEAGLEVGRVEGSDQDRDQTVTFEIVDGDSSERFSIDPITGVTTIKPDATFDFETEPTITLTVSATDTGDPALTATAAVTITLVDVDEPPIFVQTIEPMDATSGNQVMIDLPDNIVDDPEGTNAWEFSATYGEENLPDWLTFDPNSLTFSGIPTSLFAGPFDIQLHVHDANDLTLFSTLTITINVTVSEKPLHNAVSRHDVNGDSNVTANDALRIINFLSVQTPDTRYDQAARIGAFFDVTGDNFVTSLDALQVINKLANLLLSGPEDERIAVDFVREPERDLDAVDDVFASTLF